MRPLKIEFQAFGPYPGRECVDLEKLSRRGLFLISGETGSGKSTLLDVMTFALYGMSSGHGRDDFHAMRCTRAQDTVPTVVIFEFEVNGTVYHFERRLEKKKKLFAEGYSILVKDEDGIWNPLLDHTKGDHLTKKATELIGLNYEQFRQVVILPQGQFEKLLTSDSKEKEEILTSIFGEEKWAGIAETMFQQASDRQTALSKKYESIMARLMEDGCNSLEGLGFLAESFQKELTQLQDSFAENDLDSRIKQLQDMLVLAARFRDLHKEEKNAEQLENEKEKVAQEEKVLEASLRAENVRQLIIDVSTAEKNLQQRQQDLEKVQKDEARFAEEAEKAGKLLQEQLEKATDIENLKKAQTQYEERRKDYEGIGAVRASVNASQKEVAAALSEEQKARAAFEAYAGKITALQEEYRGLDEAHRHMLSIYLGGISGYLAKDLKDGEPCPVCGSIHHPSKAVLVDEEITKEAVDGKKQEADEKYRQLNQCISQQEAAGKVHGEKVAAVSQKNAELAGLQAQLKSMEASLMEGISTLEELDQHIGQITRQVAAYEQARKLLEEQEKSAREKHAAAKANIGTAQEEIGKAQEKLQVSREALEKGLQENGFESVAVVQGCLMSADARGRLQESITSHYARVKATGEKIQEITKELSGKVEPSEDCEENLKNLQEERAKYAGRIAELKTCYSRLSEKLAVLKKESEGLEDALRQAGEDVLFAKRLRGDASMGLKRYVLGIKFSTVISAANKMLEKIHGGRYQLFRTDDKGQGTNKRGLELKVYDTQSPESEGRSVKTLSGGEKFLVSLALSIGMSTVAQKSGIRIEALFIDEGFGSLDADSVGDAMNVLGSIQKSNGLVGIISHMQILQTRVPMKLVISKGKDGSSIKETIG